MGCKKRGKKKRIASIIASVLVSISCVAFPQSYPEEFSGAMFAGNTGEVPVSMCMTSAENIPYLVPELPPCGEAFWYGTFVGDAQASVLALDFFVDGERVVCAAPSVWHERIFPWNPDVQAYARLAADPEMPWVVSFEVITVDWSFEFGTYREGVFVFSGHPPVWWEISGDHPYFEYNVAPSDAKLHIYFAE